YRDAATGVIGCGRCRGIASQLIASGCRGDWGPSDADLPPPLEPSVHWNHAQMRRPTTEQATPARSTNKGTSNTISGLPSLAFCIVFAAAVFCLYMGTAVVLEARNATTHFGADSWYYSELAKGNVFN